MKFKIVYSKPMRYYVDGKQVTKKKFDELCPGKPLTTQRHVATLSMSSKTWPRTSDAFGVHPKQKKKAEALYRKRGVPTEFDAKTGKAIIRDNQHQRDLLKLRKWINYDGGYGEVTG